MQNTQIILLLLTVLAANLPWFSQRLFYFLPVAMPKNGWWCLLELIVLYFVMGGIAFYTEKASMGQIEVKHWEFYAITACMFLVFAFPGFVYRYLWKK